MSYRGRVKNGVIVLDEPASLPEGAVVAVDLVESATPKNWADRLSNLIGSVDGLPPDFAENHDYYIHALPKRNESK